MEQVSTVKTALMAERWKHYARCVASCAGRRSKDACSDGELTIIGSGIAHPDLTLNDEARIRAADRVFYCTNDRVTQTWINHVSPGAFDLRILYDDKKERFDTYVQMAEAMLHSVRSGERALGVFYGHPGIFATPAHRAIQIARREGYKASMRPAISALDYVIADIGFDPMSPGLQTFDATELLLCNRRIDPSLHVVLWQVGMVGESSFSPGGFANSGFLAFVDFLERTYGPDWKIVHYIASQYVGVEPLIQSHDIASLRTEEVRSRLSCLSTFYIAPQPSGARKKARSQEPLGEPRHADFDISRYGPRELRAIRQLSELSAPAHYVTAASSPAAELMLELSRDISLLAEYERDPAQVLQGPRIKQLTERAVKLLAIAHPLSISAALNEPAATVDD